MQRGERRGRRPRPEQIRVQVPATFGFDRKLPDSPPGSMWQWLDVRRSELLVRRAEEVLEQQLPGADNRESRERLLPGLLVDWYIRQAWERIGRGDLKASPSTLVDAVAARPQRARSLPACEQARYISVPAGTLRLWSSAVEAWQDVEGIWATISPCDNPKREYRTVVTWVGAKSGRSSEEAARYASWIMGPNASLTSVVLPTMVDREGKSGRWGDLARAVRALALASFAQE